MQQVLRSIFFVDKKADSNFKFWTLLGPFLLFFSLILATSHLALFSVSCFFICYRFRFKGLFLAITALVIYGFYIQVNLNENHLWHLGLNCSIALSLIISTYGFEEVKKYVPSDKEEDVNDKVDIQNELKQKEKNFEAFQKTFQDNFNKLKNELNAQIKKCSSIENENAGLRKEIQEDLNKKDYLLNELDQKADEIETLKEEKDLIYEKLSKLKDEEHLQEKNKTLEEEIYKLNASLKKQKEDAHLQLNEKTEKISLLEEELKKLEEKLEDHKDNINYEKTDNEIIEEYENKIKEFNRLNSLYVQLKAQFEDKQLVLHKTRQDLFQAKEQLVAMQRNENKDCEDINEEEKIVFNILDEADQEIANYKMENQHLEDIVQSLLKMEEET